MENNKKESSLFHCSSYDVPYLQYLVLLIPPPQRHIMVREKVRRDVAKVIREAEWLLSEDSDNADKVVQQTSVKLSKAWRRQTRNGWSQQQQQRALGEASSCRNGNKRRWLFTWRVRLLSSSPQDVDAERLHQLMRWLDEFMEEKSIKGY